ncbi:MAG: hypothetical protein DSZ07_01610 [Sulfurovum sp.]|nr:MAG: hypothetical protein DSZ07_01610 [Sulfurovum sp.]
MKIKKTYGRIAILLILLSIGGEAKNNLLGKAFSKVVLHGVDKALEDLDKGKDSKILNYYKDMEKNNIDFETNTKIIQDKKIYKISQNGIVLILKYPNKVRAGKQFIIEAKMVNDSQNARMGGLTLSFPQYSALEGSIIDKKFDKVTGYAPPKKMYSGILKKSFKINYFVIEGWENKWEQDTSRYMKIKLLAPTDTNKLEINIRGILIIGSKSSKKELVSPLKSSSLITDQQGYFVQRISINLE